jgi:hypothetical protein
MALTRLLLLLGFVGLAVMGCSQSNQDTASEANPVSGVDFLMFPNPQASVGTGDYSVLFVNTTPLPTIPTPYTLTVTQTDGTVQTFSGNLSPTGAIITNNFEAKNSGGATISLNSNGVLALMVLRVGGATSNIAVSSAVVNPSIDLPRFQIDQAAYANAYYAVADPGAAKTTLATFRSANGFNAANCQPSNTVSVEEYEVKFRDVHDLGYGRHMCVHRNKATGDVAVWVENFQVTAIPGQHYERVNLEALIADDRRWHVGTNAIEYSATPTSGGVKFVKFYTFNPDGTRRTFVDLDGRGAKAMPVPCISCHGGKGLPLTAAGAFPVIAAFPRADTLAHMQPLNVDTLDFWDQSPWTRADQEASLKAINKVVLCTYPLPGAVAGPEDACRTATVGAAQWQGTTAEMVKAWYGGTGMLNPAALDNYVPTGWQDGQTAPVSGLTVPAGATNLYRTVVAPYCRVCHALRGNGNFPGANDIDFTEYFKFIGSNGYEGFAVGPAGGGHYNRIKYHVFDKGNMPLALLKWDQFWASAAPAALAAFVPGATSGGNTLQPNRPVAIPGPDRMRLRTGTAVKLSGADSINAASYRWRITSANAANATFSGLNTVRPTFTANVAGLYTVELIVNDGSSDSTPVTQTLVSAAANPDPNSIRWQDIRNILQNTGGILPGTPCTGCHFVASGNFGPPVFYDDYDRVGDGNPVSAANVHQFYLDMRARLNFTDVEASLLLRRPSGHHHPGGLLDGFDVNNQGTGNRVHYDTILNWIANGAPE